jgi:hypothetical protein
MPAMIRQMHEQMNELRWIRSGAHIPISHRNAQQLSPDPSTDLCTGRRFLSA